MNFIENDTDYLEGTKTILDSPTYGGQACSLLGQDVTDPVSNLTNCEFGMINSFQVSHYRIYLIYITA